MPFSINKFAREFGYADDYDSLNATSQREILRKIQRAYKVPVTGWLDASMIDVINERKRCGCPDVHPLADKMQRWAITDLKVYVESVVTSPMMTGDEYLTAVDWCFERTRAVCGLNVESTPSSANADIVLGAGRGRRVQFDGAGGILAYMELPNSPAYRGKLRGMVDLDEEFAFTLDPHEANGHPMIQPVLLHEFGHAWGMYHDSEPDEDALMDAFYNPLVTDWLPADIRRLQARYGEPEPEPNKPFNKSIRSVETIIRVTYTDGHYEDYGPGNLKPRKVN